MERVVREARERGPRDPLQRRRREIRISLSPSMFEGFAERTYQLTTIQGSAADILKIAMINWTKR